MDWERGMERIALWKKAGKPIYLTSGGFDPLHLGHVKCLLHSAILAEKDGGKLVVLVNCDGFLTRKKGKPFMPEAERVQIIGAIKGVDLALVWESDEQTVIEAIKRIKPDLFTKGGDRVSEETIPEWEICQKVGCKVLTGIGGEKIQSSSWLLNAR